MKNNLIAIILEKALCKIEGPLLKINRSSSSILNYRIKENIGWLPEEISF